MGNLSFKMLAEGERVLPGLWSSETEGLNALDLI